LDILIVKRGGKGNEKTKAPSPESPGDMGRGGEIPLACVVVVALTRFHPEMALFRKLCVNQRN